MLVLSLIQGTSRNFSIQAVNSDGTPAVGIFIETGTPDTLTTKVWPGFTEGPISSITASTTWQNPSSSPTDGIFNISFSDTETATLAIGKYRIQTTVVRASISSRTAVVFDGYLQITEAPGSIVPTDLIDQDIFEAFATNRGLSDDEERVVPQLITAASRLIRKHCNRWFNRKPKGSIPAYDGLYTLDWPSRTIVLRQFPVNGILRVRTNPTQVFNVTNTSSSNQQAWVSLTYSGLADVSDVPPTTTGMTFNRISSGVLATPVNLTFTGGNATFQGLATSINALGNGWSASIEDPKFTLWPTSDLRQGIGPSCAIGTYAQQGFWVHADDVPVQVDQEAGIVTITAGNIDPWTSPRFGLYLDTGLGDLDIGGGFNGVRISYDAGWDTVPEDIQEACVETVIDLLNLIDLNQHIHSESDGSYKYELTNLERYAFPPTVLGKLGYYRNVRS